MSDSLNQIGRALGRTKNLEEYNSSRFTKNFPLIVGSKDKFDCQFPFELEIKVYESTQKTTLNLYFWEDPCPCRTCGET